MRPGVGSGVRCDKCAPPLGGGLTFESLYDANAGWHDKGNKKSVKMRGKEVGRGEGEMINGSGSRLFGL